VLWNTFRSFGPLKTARFDHHLFQPGKEPLPREQDRAIYYAAAAIATCLAEFFQDTRTIPSSMHAHRPAVALYERAQAALPSVPRFNRPLSDPALLIDLDRAARNLGYRLT